MSLVPSEIEYQNDSDAVRGTARISGVTIFVMLGLLASGFGSVGYLAFDEMKRGAPVIADASPDAQSGAEGAQATPSAAPAIDPVADDADASPENGEAFLDDAKDFVVAQSQASDDRPAIPPSAPERKPHSTPAPTVVYDPAVFDDVAAEPEIEAAPASPAGTPAPENRAAARPDEATPDTADSASAGAAPVAGDPPVDEPPAEQPAPIPATIDALSGSHVVQLASYRSPEEALADWRRIQSRLGDYLTGKTYQIQEADLGDRGVFHRLRIGPFASSDAAQTYCQGLKERGQDCLALRR